MPIFSFIGHNRTELIGKTFYWRQIHKQMSLTFYSSKVVLLQNNVLRRKILAITFTYKSVKVEEVSTYDVHTGRCV